MASEANARVDLTGLEDAFEAVKGHKNAIVGGLLVVVLGVAVSIFVMRQVRDSAVGPWRAVFNEVGGPWRLSSKEVDNARASVHDVAANTYLAYWSAIRRFDERDSKGANEALDAYRRDSVPAYKAKYGSDPIAATPMILGTGVGSGVSSLDRFQTALREFDSWSTKHAPPTKNVVPASAQKVTIVTARGNVVLALFSDAAPKSCEMFLKLAPGLKDHFVAKAQADKWVEIGHDEKGAPLQSNAITDPAPPFERNSLSHVPGSVAFRKPPFTKGSFEGDVHVAIDSSLFDDERTTVFAQVVEGFELLTTISRDEKKTDSPSALAQPIKIVDVQVGSGGAASSSSSGPTEK